MPSPRQLARAQDFFGYGPLEVYDYIKPAGDPEDLAYSPASRQRFFLAEGMQAQRAAERDKWAAADEQRIADQAAGQILQGSRGQSSSGLLNLLADTPEVLNSRQFPNLMELQRLKAEAEKPAPYSDTVLGPQFAARIQNPRLRKEFEDEMLRGVNANAAWGNHLGREFNYNQELVMAKAGIPQSDWGNFKSADGLYNEADIQHAIRTGSPSADKELQELQYGFKSLDARRDPMGELPPEDQELYNILASRYRQKMLGKYAPQPETTAEPMGPPTALKGPPAPVVEQPAKPRLMLPSDRTKQREKTQAETEIEQVWGQNKMSLAQQLQQLIPNEQDRLDVLYAIANNAPSPEYEAAASADPTMGPVPRYTDYLLKQLGMKPRDVVFQEPGNKRWGTQGVRAEELLKAVAKDAVTAYRAAQNPANQTEADQMPTVTTPAEAAKLPKGTRFRDPEGNIRVAQ